ncbi:MAG TPA: efflux RND transporter periplasmic adaptor subunit [Thermoanaerobaculia bacterium]|jgi:HlyD family secretion protein|nr:efflux RND transporter periplasmic adaptor subunit [Thermoanaerobaculia bacterium]
MDPLENNHRQRRWLVTAIVIVVAALVGLFFLRRGKDDGGERYRTEVVDKGTVAQTVSATGALSAVTTVQVGSQVSGIISKLYVDFNSQVKKGELLAELDPTPFQQTVDQRRADVSKSKVQVANQKITYGRQQRLMQSGLIAQSDLDAAKTAYEAAVADLDLSQASLRQAETNLGYTKIFSPIDGEVVARSYDIGQTVAASFQAPTLFIIAKDLTKMQVQADVDQSDIGQIKVDEVARFSVDAYPEQEFRGRIAQVRLNATVNQNVITYPVMIEVPNPDGKLRPSMTANVTIEVARVQDVLRVPNSALRFRPTLETGKDAKAKPAGTPGQPPAAGERTPVPGQTPGGAPEGRRHWNGQGGQGGPGGPGAPGGPGGSPGGEPASTERSVAGLGEHGQGMNDLGKVFPGGGGHQGGRRQTQTVYVVGLKNELRPVTIRPGISDGHYTQILQVVDGTLSPGDKVAVGLATAKVETTGGFPGSTPGARPGGGRPGGRF